MKIPLTLMILDGFGLAPPSNSNAVTLAKTPVLDELFRTCPHTVLRASGEDVGLPDGQVGNSEVGHMNIGAGRVVYQDLLRINRDIDSGGFFRNAVLRGIMERCKTRESALHLIGLLSPGGVHSHERHLYALLKMAAELGLRQVFIHCFLDGRDVSPTGARASLAALEEKCRDLGAGAIATVTGRYYAMDREECWDRVELAYDALTLGRGDYSAQPILAVGDSYDNGVTDEFVRPIICRNDGIITDGDGVIFFNFRADRARELPRALTDPDFTGFQRKKELQDLDFVCFTQYDRTMSGVAVAYPDASLSGTFGEIVSALGLAQFRTSETTKYAHVTYFFNGGEERVFPGEDRLLIPSPTEYATYDLIPEMSAFAVAKAAAERIRSGKYDVVIMNFANCDMVGHTGVLSAAIKAVEAVDACVGIVLDAVRNAGGI
ncbi:MAG: 2,3-bisphosphoglycerate-independent phosphoglycerate mutase, partial [Oscillospiraceae bacterium]|nr:2,3-bisphosphoglycerate-independent phosphoglycerate mutase [Oscillospiraceae bacterium]